MDRHGEGVGPPQLRAAELRDAGPFPSFAAYMERCLYDERFGYYAAGKVALAPGGHFGTFPQLLTPLFGHLVAEAARPLLEALAASAHVPASAPLTVLELGAGDGSLARQTLDYLVDRRETARWRGLADRVRYVVGEASRALREVQRSAVAHHVRAGRAEVRPLDARRPAWDGPFYGLVVANELLDVFPVERLRLRSPDEVARVHIVPLVDGATVRDRALEVVDTATVENHPLDGPSVAVTAGSLWRLLADGSFDSAGGRLTLAELEVPLELGWYGQDGPAEAPPEELVAYLDATRPLVADLETCGRLPVDLHVAPSMADFVGGLADLLVGDDRDGAALLVDYGGTTRYVLDPAAGPHLRVFGPDRERAHSADPYHDPGAYDITWDVDFTELGRLAARHGLETPFFGHQRALARPLRHHGLDRSIAAMLAALERDGIDDPDLARGMVDQRLAAFRDAPSFRMLLVTPPETDDVAAWFGQSDALAGDGLRTLAPDVDRDELAAVLGAVGVPDDVVDVLHSGGDPVGDLSDHQFYHHRHAVLDVLDRQGWLVAPGDLADDSGSADQRA